MPGRGDFKDPAKWPPSDQKRWKRGLSPASLLHSTGHAARWRPGTISKISRAHACFLNWLDSTGQLDRNALPADRCTPERVDAYCVYLAESVRPTTIRIHITGLERALSVLQPGADLRFLRQRAARFPKVGDPLKKRQRLKDSATILQLGFDLMAKAETPEKPTRGGAVLYRDGLMIALLAYRPLRLRNFTNIKTTQNLRRSDTGWRLQFSAAETKNHKSWFASFPPQLVPHLESYISVFRPLLLRNRQDEGWLWISERSNPLTDNGIFYAITTRTRAAFGKSINPHLFRDSAATSLAVHDPAHVRLGSHVLGNTFRTMQTHYNQAQCIQASDALNATTDKLRRTKKKRS